MNLKKLIFVVFIIVIGIVTFSCLKSSKPRSYAPSTPQHVEQQPGHDPIQPVSAPQTHSAPVAVRTDLNITTNPATNSPRFVTAPAGQVLAHSNPTLSLSDNAIEYFKAQGDLFGIRNPAQDLKLQNEMKDNVGMAHVKFQQVYQGLDVFGGSLNAHFDRNGELVVVNGSYIPGIAVNTAADVSENQAGQLALQQLAEKQNVNVTQAKLLIFRENLLRGTPGPDHLAWQVEVGNGHDIRQIFYVDAHQPRVIDTIDQVKHKMKRRAFDAKFSEEELPLPNYPSHPYWKEGDAFPSKVICSTLSDFPLCNQEADKMILTMKETYDFFYQTFGRDSFDNHGTPMDTYFDSLSGCPNASWNGVFTQYCPGVDGKDVVAHEFGHAVTEHTANLEYQWQAGALNEGFSDMWGELVALLHRPDPHKLNVPRTQACSLMADKPFEMARIGLLNITAPKSLAGFKISSAGLAGPVITRAYHGAIAKAVPLDACQMLSNNLSGKLALLTASPMFMGDCSLEEKIKHAQEAGALGIIAMSEYPDSLPDMFGYDPDIKIPVVGISLNDGVAIQAALLKAPVQASIQPPAAVLDKSTRWLVGFDSEMMGTLRDMSAPNCKNQPAKTTDPIYWCFMGDGGGVHMNSGIPNRVFSLLSDGGNAQGHQIQALGLLKTAHIHYRALSAYLVSNSDFSDYGNALIQSCSDLKGVNLKSFKGSKSGTQLSAANCAQVSAVVNALELRSGPKQCNFQPILKKSPPTQCESGAHYFLIFKDNFTYPRGWTATHSGQTKDFTKRDWSLKYSLPGDRTSPAYFSPNLNIGTCRPGDAQRVLMHLDSPVITMPSTVSGLKLKIQHYVATEPGFSGGNLKIQVNGGSWQLIKASDFIYNPYNMKLHPKTNSANPLAGQPAFSGIDGGTFTGSWGASIMNLQHYRVTPFSTVKLRFDMGNDDCGGVDGWYLGEVELYGCQG